VYLNPLGEDDIKIFRKIEARSEGKCVDDTVRVRGGIGERPGVFVKEEREESTQLPEGEKPCGTLAET